MLTKRNMFGFVCVIGHKYYGAIGCVGDISLIAISIYVLNKMGDIYVEFAFEYDLKFIPSKCQLIKYSSRPDSPFYCDGTQVKYI